MTHVPSVGERNPPHTRDELEEWLLANILRRVVFAVVDQRRGGDLWQAGDARPAHQ